MIGLRDIFALLWPQKPWGPVTSAGAKVEDAFIVLFRTAHQSPII